MVCTQQSCCIIKIRGAKWEEVTISEQFHMYIILFCKLFMQLYLSQSSLYLSNNIVTLFWLDISSFKAIFHSTNNSFSFISRPIGKKCFLQHVEELCANNNLKFQEEFSVCYKQLSQHYKTSTRFMCHISCPF